MGGAGGWCRSIDDCYERSLTSLGSSNSYPPSMASEGVLSNNKDINPYFYEWNAVFLMCTHMLACLCTHVS